MLIGDPLWSRFPIVGPAPAEPLSQNPILEIETPETQYLYVDDVEVLRFWGNEIGTITDSQADPSVSGDYSWGVSRFGGIPSTDDYEQFQNPLASGEIVRRFDRLHCVDVDEADIVPGGTAFELVRFDVDHNTIGVLQRIVTTWRVTALDDVGTPLFVFDDNGQEACVDELVHPTAGVGSLTWTFRLTRTPKSWSGAPPTVAYRGPADPGAIAGTDTIEPWGDLRYGGAEYWGTEQYVLVEPGSTVTLWAVVSGATDRFRIDRFGARLAGYTQRCGRRGAALCSATNRYP